MHRHFFAKLTSIGLAAQLGISGMACEVTGKTSWIQHTWRSRNRRRSGDCCRCSRDRWFKLPCAPQIGHGSQPPPASVTCSETLLGAWQPWPVRPSPTRPREVIGLKELLSELIARARMLRPHLGSRLVSTLLLAYATRQRWGAMRAYDCLYELI